MSRRILLQGAVAGILAAAAAVIYNRIYFFATQVDFSGVLNWVALIGLNLVAGLVAAIVYWFFKKWLKEKGEVAFNFFLSISCFACVIIPISITLPLTIPYPELFPGLAVPMVFFPAMAWFTINPLFKK